MRFTSQTSPFTEKNGSTRRREVRDAEEKLGERLAEKGREETEEERTSEKKEREREKNRKEGKRREKEKRARSSAHIQIPGADQSVGGRSSKILEPPTRASINLPYPPFHGGGPGLYTWPRLVKGLPQLKL